MFDTVPSMDTETSGSHRTVVEESSFTHGTSGHHPYNVPNSEDSSPLSVVHVVTYTGHPPFPSLPSGPPYGPPPSPPRSPVDPHVLPFLGERGR